VVAEQVGLRADGKPVVVVGGDSKWRRFTDSGDSRHTAVQDDVAGYRLTADGTIEGDLPEGFESADTAAGLTPLEGAAKFGDPVPFSAGAGRQGRDLSVVPGSDVRVESRPLSEGPGSAVTGRAYLATREFDAFEPVGGPSELVGFKADLPTYRHVMMDAADPDRVVQELGRMPVPWRGGSAPYVVMTFKRSDGVRVAAEHGGDHELTFDQFAELVAADPQLKALPPDVPVFLAATNAARSDLELVRRIAAVTDRVVYAPTNRIAMDTAEHGGWSFALEAPATVGGDKPGPRGQIVRIDPPSRGGVDPGPRQSGSVTTLDGDVVPDRMVLMRPIIDAQGIPIHGRSSHDDASWASREFSYAVALGDRAYVADSRGPVAVRRPVPWGEHTYFFIAHAARTAVALKSVDNFTDTVSGTELGRLLRRRPSIAALLNRAEQQGEVPSITLVACQSAALAQEVADATGMVVHAPNSITGLLGGRPPANKAIVAPELRVDVRPETGAYGEFLTFHPNELSPEALGNGGMTMDSYVAAFDHKVTSLSAGEAEAVRVVGQRIAPELIRRHLAGLELPVVTVTGRGNGRFTAAWTGLKRAKSVRALLVDEIGAKLADAKVELDLDSLIRVESVGRGELPAEITPGGTPEERQRSAMISVEFPSAVAPVSSVVRSRDVPSGVWVTDRSLSASSQVQFREALD
ncbi:hypothetical protein AB0K51_34770, partial [Kitasatospora sp. NPDC049285]|uniref:hypothetical protein n=1 Tax=Kitasatospora sp. NPDC049285 TaxID=3157096 RepID=UPI0034401997